MAQFSKLLLEALPAAAPLTLLSKSLAQCLKAFSKPGTEFPFRLGLPLWEEVCSKLGSLRKTEKCASAGYCIPPGENGVRGAFCPGFPSMQVPGHIWLSAHGAKRSGYCVKSPVPATSSPQNEPTSSLLRPFDTTPAFHSTLCRHHTSNTK